MLGQRPALFRPYDLAIGDRILGSQIKEVQAPPRHPRRQRAKSNARRLMLAMSMRYCLEPIADTVGIVAENVAFHSLARVHCGQLVLLAA